MSMQKLIQVVRSVTKTLRRNYKKILNKFRSNPFDRKYLDKYNLLNCKEDIEKVVKMSAKKITNVMAAWYEYRRKFGCTKTHTNDETVVAFVPNKRMRVFLQHLTKWKVSADLPKTPFLYFGINPDRKELQDIKQLNETVGCSGGIVVGTDTDFLSSVLKTCDCRYYWDHAILGPNKTVSHF